MTILAAGTVSQLRTALARWYERHQRDLPWRRTRDPYRIWLSEIMLQQTRVAAVIPYYERFLERFPDVASLAAAPEAELLALWAGLGYYSRARNLQKAARTVVERGSFPDNYDALRELPGVGDYTAAAIASIAYGLPHAVVDGNVRRVLSRLTGTVEGIPETANRLLDRKRPERHNQAVMELGALVCLPREPRCGECPLAVRCEAFRSGRQRELPGRKKDARIVEEEIRLAIARRGEAVLLWRRDAGDRRMAGFWELPEVRQIPRGASGKPLCRFAHAITYHRYNVVVYPARVVRKPHGMEWVSFERLPELPLSTIARKALRNGISELTF